MPGVGALVTVPPGHPGFSAFIDDLKSRLTAEPVFLYCLDDGVLATADSRLQEMRGKGLRLFACAYGSRKRSLPLDDSALFAGLGTLGDLIADTSSFTALEGLPSAVNASGTKAIVIECARDPRVSHRPAEAVRVSAGLQSGGRVRVTLFLHGQARDTLNPDTSGFIDGTDIARYMKTCRNAGTEIVHEKPDDSVSAWIVF